MNLRTFDSADAFLESVEPTLLANEAENALILGVTLRLRDGHSFGDEPPFLAYVEENGKIAAIGARTPPYNLLVREATAAGQALELLARHLYTEGVRLPGVHGERASAVGLAERWTRLTGIRSKIAMAQRLYKLSEVDPPSGVPGCFRLAGLEDRDLLIAWVGGFVDEAVGGAPHPDPAGLVDRLTSDGALAVWDAAAAVSMASSNRPTPNGIAINLVYTPTAKRRRGYASACVAAISQRELDAGKRFCTLFTDLANPSSNALYQRVGYRPLADFVEIRFFEDGWDGDVPLDGA